MFTWSFGCAPSPARLAITSLAFMFELVPEPVWKTSMGNWSSWRPSAISSPAAAMRSASSASSRPRSALTRAAVALMRPSQRMTGTGIGCSLTGKFATAFVVSPPQSSRRSSVVLISSNLALRQTRPQAALVGGAPAAEPGRFGTEPPDNLGAQAVALRALSRGADQVAELERGPLVARPGAVAELLRGAQEEAADD